MQYSTKEEIIETVKKLLYCMENEHYEDAQQHCLVVSNGLYGIACRRSSKVLIALEDVMREAGYMVNPK